MAVVNALDSAVGLFDLVQHKFSKIGLAQTGGLQAPLGLSVDADGNWFVADGQTGFIVVFNAQGQRLRRIGGPQWFARLTNVTVDPHRSRVYGLDQGERQSRVRVFNSVDGRHLFDFGGPGDGPGQFNLPQDLAVGKAGRLYVVDSGNYRVQMFDPAGKFVGSFGEAGKRPGQFGRPKEIAVDAAGRVYVVDASHGNIQVFDADGGYLYFIGTRGDQGAAATYMLPTGIAIDVDGRLYVADQGYRKFDIYRPLPDSGAGSRPATAAAISN
ncbi:NHL repeat protein [mine drainage metagenome]|uniref:NHL repeat protein n=1 Tax=mine drainage metagenome TaxID=410659 RepID=A0A1J5P7T3_9ZZZZ